VTALPSLAALLVGAAFGYGAQRGAFCMNSGMRSALVGEWTKLKALGLAVAVQLLVLPVVFATGLAQPAGLPLRPVAATAGGLLFGASMRWAGGCAAGAWYKLGSGDLGALLVVLGMALGATATETGPLVTARVSLQEMVPAFAYGAAPFALSFICGVVLLAALARALDGRAGGWSWRRTGLWIGVSAALVWPVSAAAGRQFGLAVMTGTTGLLASVSGRGFSAWDVLLVLGIPIGGWLAARRAGSARLDAPSAPLLLKRLAGGLGLGIGASLAGGCTVGHGLTGLALLAPASVVVMTSIFAGSSVAELGARRLRARQRLPHPSASR
jgi:uncharacterized membrane protein YedE/YeeE